MTILDLALQYNNFQNDFGSVNNNYSQLIEQLFTPDFKKIANKNCLVATRNELENQLKSVKEFAGNWQIISIYNIPSQDGKTCTIRYELHRKKAGKFDIMAVLISENGKQISQIDELFHQI